MAQRYGKWSISKIASQKLIIVTITNINLGIINNYKTINNASNKKYSTK